MALRARLGPPTPPSRQEWPWHSLDSRAVSVSTITRGDRRLEAETYLSPGFKIKAAIERHRSGWRLLSEVARVWKPGRQKGIQVSSNIGTPFLTATQAFDINPVARKWLSLERTTGAQSLFAKSGQILVTCSGSVGRPAVTSEPHEGMLISSDLLRVDPIEPSRRGWIYGYLNAAKTRQMEVGSHYGHIIKHLETSHLEAMPIPDIDDVGAEAFNSVFDRLVSYRDRAHQLTKEAEMLFESRLGPLLIDDWGETGFVTRAASALTSGRRRFEAAAHNPGAASIRRHLRKNGQGMIALAKAGFEVWLPARFKRIPSEKGVLLLDTSSLGAANPQPTKRIKDGDFGDPFRGRVKAGWVLVPRSGQVYGILGTPTMALSSWKEWVVSDHALRIRPISSDNLPTGYVVMALGHPTLGRPVVKSLAYGSSVPDIEPTDLGSLEIVRLGEDVETEIATLVEAASDARESADLLEQQLGHNADEIIDRFISSGRRQTTTFDTQQLARRVLDAVTPDA